MPHNSDITCTVRVECSTEVCLCKCSKLARLSLCCHNSDIYSESKVSNGSLYV